MPKWQFTDPDGLTLEVEGEDTPSREQLDDLVRKYREVNIDVEPPAEFRAPKVPTSPEERGAQSFYEAERLKPSWEGSQMVQTPTDVSGPEQEILTKRTPIQIGSGTGYTIDELLSMEPPEEGVIAKLEKEYGLMYGPFGPAAGRIASNALHLAGRGVAKLGKEILATSIRHPDVMRESPLQIQAPPSETERAQREAGAQQVANIPPDVPMLEPHIITKEEMDLAGGTPDLMVAAGLYNTAAKFVSQMSSPANLATLPAALTPAGRMTMAASMAPEIPKSALELAKTMADPKAGLLEKIERAGDLGLASYFTYKMAVDQGLPRSGREAAREQALAERRTKLGGEKLEAKRPEDQIKEAGPLPSVEGQPPVAETERQAQERVAPEAGARGEVGVPSQQDYELAEREAIDVGQALGSPVEVVDRFTGDDPYAGRDHVTFMQATPQGVQIHRENFRHWLRTRDPSTWTQAIRGEVEQRYGGRMGEEHIHRHIEDADAKGYWHNLTWAEKMNEIRQYTGGWSLERFNRLNDLTGDAALNDTKMGHEAIRRRIQRLTGPAAEVAGAALKERWKLQTLDFIADLIRSIREDLGTKASAEQLSIMDRVSKNLEVARLAISQQPAAALIREDDIRKARSTEDAIRLGLGARNIDDLNDLAEIRVNLAKEGREAFEGGRFSEGMATMTKAQFAREAIEAATNTGGHVEGEGMRPASYGARPLDWQEKPEVAAWLRENGQEVGIAFKEPSAAPGAVIREGELKNPEDYNDKDFDQNVSVFAGKRLRDGSMMYAREHAAGAMEITPGENGFLLVPHNSEDRGLDPMTFNLNEAHFSTMDRHKYGIRFVTFPEADAARGDFRAALLKQFPVSQRGPGAIIRQSEFSLEPQKGPREAIPALRPGQRQVALPLAPVKPGEAIERPGATELGAKPLTPFELHREGYAEMARAVETLDEYPVDSLGGKKLPRQAQIPNFDNFVERLRMTFGDLKPGQLRESWERVISTLLNNASGERLTKLARALGTDRIKGQEGQYRSPIPSSREIEELTAEAHAARGAQAKKLQDKLVEERQRRDRGISDIFRKLQEEAAPKPATLSRKAVKPDELAWESQPDPYRTITTSEAENPDTLAKVLTEGSRQSRHDEVSITRRLTAIYDRQSGKIFLVSTYPKAGRAGAPSQAMVVDPTATGLRRHRPLDGVMLKRYRPIATMLLDEPVKDFSQAFKSAGDYFKKFGEEASSRGRAGLEQRIETRRAARPPLSTGESGTLWRWSRGVKSPEDLQKLMANLTLRAEKGILRPEHHAVISAMTKAHDVLLASDPILRQNPEMAAAAVLDKLYDHITQSKNRADFISRTMGEFAPAPPADIPPGTPAPGRLVSAAQYPSTSRELTAISRRPPWDVAGVPRGTEPPQRIAGAGQVRPAERIPGMPTEPELAPPSRPTIAPAIPLGEHVPGRPAYAGQLPPGGAFRGKPGAAKLPQATETPEDFTEAMNREADLWNLPKKERPAAVRRLDDIARDTSEQIRSWMSRRESKATIAMLAQRADTLEADYTEKAKRRIEEPSSTGHQEFGDPKMLTGMRALNATYENGQPTTAGFQPNYDWVALGLRKAKLLARVPTQRTLDRLGLTDVRAKTRNQIARMAKDWIANQGRLKAELDFASKNYSSRVLRESTDRFREETAEQIAREHAAGINTREFPNYVQGLYDGDYFTDNAVVFGAVQVLGKSFGKPKAFSNVYEASAAGPYIPKFNNLALSAANRTRSGMRRILQREAFMAIKGILDPDTNTPIAIDPVKLSDGTWGTHDVQRVLVDPWSSGRPLAVRKGYEGLIKNLYAADTLTESPGMKAALWTEAALKHGALLIMDTFHLGRLSMYSLALTGFPRGWKGGYAALEWSGETFRSPISDLQRAADQGLIPQEAVDWATSREDVTIGGIPRVMTKQEIGRELMHSGLAVGRIQDALYKHIVDSWDLPWKLRGATRSYSIGLGAYNRFLFDKFTRGLMMHTAVEDFIRLNRLNTGMDAPDLMRRVAQDTNIFFGNLGKTGFLHNRSMSSIARVLFLAPQWVEGLAQKEIRFAARAVKAPYVMGRELARGANLGEAYRAGKVEFGTIGRGMGRGLLGMLLLTQALNLITKRQPTWKNEEEHKLDVWIPSWEGKAGFWISPLSIFAELTHDVVRLAYSSEKVWDIANKIGHNKLSPVGRFALVLSSGLTPTSQKITTTAGVALTAAAQLKPVPISFGRFAQAGAHAIAPSMIPPPPRGTMQRQVLSLFGVKGEPALSNLQYIGNKATRFARENNLVKTSGWVQVQTDEANYSKLRGALRNQDYAGALSNVRQMMKTGHTLKDIMDSMNGWAKRPLTGSDDAEHAFLSSMTDEDRERYTAARWEKQELLIQFRQWLMGLDWRKLD